MAHPHRKEASDGHNAKLRKMTTHYGLADPSMNQSAPVNAQKASGPFPEDNVGFGADSNGKTAKRGDKPARKAVTANPVATYAKGGKVKHRDGGGDVSTIEEANQNQAAANRARGGRLHAGKKSKHGTHVNVIVAPQGGPQGMAGPSPQLAGLAAGAHPPMPPPAPPPGMPAGGPMAAGPMPPGPPGGPPPMMRKRGGKVMGDHPDAAQDKALIEKTLKEEGLIRRARGGGLHLTAGAASGEGRLEKYNYQKKHPVSKQEV